MPAVTVVVPTYRRLTHLDEALASLRAQTLTDLEVLVCDNGADPAVEAKVAALGDSRFRYVPRPENVGLARNALLGFAEARSPLVAKLDDDDAFEPHTLTPLVAAFDRCPEIDVAFGRLRLVDGAGEVLRGLTAEMDEGSGRSHMPEGVVEDLDAAITSAALSLACAVFRRDVLDAGVPESVATAYDLHVLLLLAAGGRPAWYAPGATTRYRLHPANDSSTGAVRQGLGALAAYDLALGQARRDPRRRADLLTAARSHTALLTARELVRAGESRRAREVLVADLRRHPTLAVARLALGTYLPADLAARISLARRRAVENSRAARGLERVR